MTVKELIRQLSNSDRDRIVKVEVLCPCGCGERRFIADIVSSLYRLNDDIIIRVE